MTAPIATTADLRGRQVLVLGLARSGAAAARMLSDAGARVTVYDRRSAADLAEAVASLGERPIRLALAASEADARLLLSAADLVVTSPSISSRFPTTEAWLRDALRRGRGARGAPVIGEVDLFLRLTRSRVLAVTGTKGKTTTTSLIGAIMAAADMPHLVGGNIGTPLIEQVGRLDAGRLGRARAVRAAAADHLARRRRRGLHQHRLRPPRPPRQRGGVPRGQGHAWPELSGAGTVVLNADDPGCRELGATAARRRCAGTDSHGLADGAACGDDRLISWTASRSCRSPTCRCPGGTC